MFQLFGELAGVDVRSVVPSSHVLDCQPMLAYLTDPTAPAVRKYVFAQAGNGLKAPTTHIWPTVLTIGPENICTDSLFTSQSLAETEGGTWYGPGGSQTFYTACDVRAANIYSNLTVLPTRSWTALTDRFKLIQFERAPCDSALGSYEFYDLRPTPLDPLNPLGIDNANRDLLTNGVPANLTPEQTLAYNELKTELNRILASEPACYTDGNLDKQVTQADVDGVNQYWGQASWFDINSDGTTDQTDLNCVLANLGNNCLQTGPGIVCPVPPYLADLTESSTGGFGFVFNGTAGYPYSVIASTNLLTPTSDWLVLGPAVETSPGSYEFTDPSTDNAQPRLYQVR